MPLSHLRESRHCCILNFTTWIPDSMYCTSFLLVKLVFWIPIISGILQAQERSSLIPNSTDRNPDSFTWGWAEAIHFTATTFKKNLILGEDQHECTRRGSTLTSLTVDYCMLPLWDTLMSLIVFWHIMLYWGLFNLVLFLVLSQEGY